MGLDAHYAQMKYMYITFIYLLHAFNLLIGELYFRYGYFQRHQGHSISTLSMVLWLLHFDDRAEF